MKARNLLLTTLLLFASPLFAEPLFERMNLFSANQGGYALYRIPGIVVTAKGTLLAYCEARKNAGGDWGQIDIFLRRSTDGGKTWDAPRKIVEPPKNAIRNPIAVQQRLGREGEITVNNPVAIADRDGTVHFLYCIEYGRCYYIRSDDDGVTFSPPIDLTATFEKFRAEYDWKVLATGPGHGIQLRNGRLIVPVWLSTGTGGHAHRPSAVSVIYSDDAGKTWNRGDIVVRDPEPKNPSETVAVQLSDGRVMLNIRHEGPLNRRGVTTSADGAAGWTPLKFDQALPEPVCMGSIVRLSGEPRKSRILFANPHNDVDKARKNLSVKMSTDEGETWPVARVIEPGVSAYSDLAVSADGTVYCFFELGGIGNNPYRTGHLTIARFNLEWLTEGKEKWEE